MENKLSIDTKFVKFWSLSKKIKITENDVIYYVISFYCLIRKKKIKLFLKSSKNVDMNRTKNGAILISFEFFKIV